MDEKPGSVALVLLSGIVNCLLMIGVISLAKYGLQLQPGDSSFKGFVILLALALVSGAIMGVCAKGVARYSEYGGSEYLMQWGGSSDEMKTFPISAFLITVTAILAIGAYGMTSFWAAGGAFAALGWLFHDLYRNRNWMLSGAMVALGLCSVIDIFALWHFVFYDQLPFANMFVAICVLPALLVGVSQFRTT